MNLYKAQKSRIYTPFLFTLTALILFGQSACTKAELDPINKRFDENFEGGIDIPSNIDPTGTDNFNFAVISDTHIGRPQGEVLKNLLPQFKAASDAFILTCGDNTDTGANTQYDQFVSLFKENNLTFRAAIGNHDIFFSGWDNFKHFIGRSIYSFNADNVHISILDSANGVLGQRQLDWLERDLQNASQKHKLVVTHFPPWNGTFSSVYKLASEEESAILKDMLYRHDVELMIAGHYHGYAETKIGGVKYIVTGGANDLIDPGNQQHYFRIFINGNNLRAEKVEF